MNTRPLSNTNETWDSCDSTADADVGSATSLRFALLCGTHLAGADLRGADLTGANLRDAILDNRTDLRGARLCGADLRANGLADAKFSADTIYDAETQFPHGFDPDDHDLRRS